MKIRYGRKRAVRLALREVSLKIRDPHELLQSSLSRSVHTREIKCRQLIDERERERQKIWKFASERGEMDPTRRISEHYLITRAPNFIRHFNHRGGWLAGILLQKKKHRLASSKRDKIDLIEALNESC